MTGGMVKVVQYIRSGISHDYLFVPIHTSSLPLQQPSFTFFTPPPAKASFSLSIAFSQSTSVVNRDYIVHLALLIFCLIFNSKNIPARA